MLSLAVGVDVLHAALMLAWMLGLPLLFWHRYRPLSLLYCLFSLGFIIVNQVSHYTLGECVFTTIANCLYHQAGQTAPDEWFSIRAAHFVFGLVPSHRGIKVATEVLIGISAIGGMVFCVRERKHRNGIVKGRDRKAASG